MEEAAPIIEADDVKTIPAQPSLNSQMLTGSITERDICQCDQCGCYGMLQEFISDDGIFCSISCKEKQETNLIKSRRDKEASPQPTHCAMRYVPTYTLHIHLLRGTPVY
jgi:hypothetical protein